MTKTVKMPVRIAFREEGDFWNAYLALPDTMKDAKLIGSILMMPAVRDAAIKKAFMDTMKAVLTLAVKDVTGEAPDRWYEKPAKDSEKSGNA